MLMPVPFIYGEWETAARNWRLNGRGKDAARRSKCGDLLGRSASSSKGRMFVYLRGTKAYIMKGE
jgi:hypothetical protein